MMEFTAEEQKGLSSDETRGEKSEQGQKEQLENKSKEVVALSEPGKKQQEIEVSSPRAAIVSETGTLELENLPQELSPAQWAAREVLDDVIKEASLKILKAEMKTHEESQKRLSLTSAAATPEAKAATVDKPEMENASASLDLKNTSGFSKHSDFKLEINRLQQEVKGLLAINIQKDVDIFKLELEMLQLKKDAAIILSSDVASFYSKLKETENELRSVTTQLKHVSNTYERVTKRLESTDFQLSDLSKMCDEKLRNAREVINALTSNEKFYKANITALENRVESFDGFKKDLVQIVSETNAFIEKTISDLGINTDRKVLQPFNKQ